MVLALLVVDCRGYYALRIKNEGENSAELNFSTKLFFGLVGASGSRGIATLLSPQE
ncbi:hypothetical protein [Clostridium thermarum]|uniref:hypothetical protein n=1 Tax=Clostridium thermarum TaxID=1716543 RepID=UPI0013D728DC|nr:hypothetical protein [Clostridium thermarum]